MKTQKKILLPLATLLAAGAIAVGSGATFTSTTANTISSVTSGTLSQSNSKADQAILNLTNIKPGDTINGALTITNTGSLPADFTLTETSSANGFADKYLTLTITNTTTSTQVFDGTFGALEDGAQDPARLGRRRCREQLHVQRAPGHGRPEHPAGQDGLRRLPVGLGPAGRHHHQPVVTPARGAPRSGRSLRHFRATRREETTMSASTTAAIDPATCAASAPCCSTSFSSRPPSPAWPTSRPACWGTSATSSPAGRCRAPSRRGRSPSRSRSRSDQLRVGDVITYQPPADSGVATLVTHRIVSSRCPGDRRAPVPHAGRRQRVARPVGVPALAGRATGREAHRPAAGIRLRGTRRPRRSHARHRRSRRRSSPC